MNKRISAICDVEQVLLRKLEERAPELYEIMKRSQTSRHKIWKVPNDLCLGEGDSVMTKESVKEATEVIKNMMRAMCDMMFPHNGGLVCEMLSREKQLEEKFENNVMRLFMASKKGFC